MALHQVNAGQGLDVAALRREIAQLAPGKPIVIMVHGFKFDPALPARDPHRHILSASGHAACWRGLSWPRHLWLDRQGHLGIAFGWSARGSIWTAWRATAGAAQALSALLDHLARLAPGHPVHVIAHSLGAAVALQAVGLSPTRRVDRLLLLSPAAFAGETRGLLTLTEPPEVFAVLGHENALFDLLLRAAFPWKGPTLGRGMPRQRGWLDMHLSRPGVLRRLAQIGLPIRPATAPVCHWSSYLRPGIFALYRAVLTAECPLTQSYLRRVISPDTASQPDPAELWPSPGAAPG